MNDDLAHLVKLQDMDNMIRDASEHGTEKTLGFEVGGLPLLMAAREKLRQEIPKRWLGLYERLAGRYGRAVVPVEDRICLGCFMSLPTAASTKPGDDAEPTLCEGCGRILYW